MIERKNEKIVFYIDFGGRFSDLYAQHINVGFTFQYLILKQVEVKSDQIMAARSFSLYKVIDNRWKFFTAGQSLVVGTVAQVDIKKFYFGIEPSFELNTYEYYVGYPISPTTYDKVRFHTLFLQVDVPVYVGYMFKSSNLFRYSFYAGASPVIPYSLGAQVKGDQAANNRYDWADMYNILYTTKPYLNSVTGFAIHFASLGRLDFRYVHRLGSPGPNYQTTFNTVGAGLTFFFHCTCSRKKYIMRNRIQIIFLLVMSCAIPPIDTSEKVFPPSKDTMLIRQSRYVSNASNELIFELDLYHLEGFDDGHFIRNFFLWVDSTYLIPPAGGNFKFLADDQLDATPVISTSSVILIDESGSYDSLDHFNNRTQGLTKLCKDYINPSQYLVGGFSKNGNLSNTPTDFIQANFSRYTDDQLLLLFDLAKKTGGQSNLYDAVDQAIDKVLATATTDKNIIILAHAVDEISSVQLNNVITKAQANQVQLHVLFLGAVDKANNLAKLAEATGGLFVCCSSIKELTATFENLSLMLGGSFKIKRIRIKYTPTNNTIVSGQELWFTIKTHDNHFNIDNNPLVAYVKVP